MGELVGVYPGGRQGAGTALPAVSTWWMLVRGRPCHRKDCLPKPRAVGRSYSFALYCSRRKSRSLGLSLESLVEPAELALGLECHESWRTGGYWAELAVGAGDV